MIGINAFMQVRSLFLEGRLHVARMFKTAEAQSEVEALCQELRSMVKLQSFWVCNQIAWKVTPKYMSIFTRSHIRAEYNSLDSALNGDQSLAKSSSISSFSSSRCCSCSLTLSLKHSWISRNHPRTDEEISMCRVSTLRDLWH